jgi:hypothetical protein
MMKIAMGCLLLKPNIHTVSVYRNKKVLKFFIKINRLFVCLISEQTTACAKTLLYQAKLMTCCLIWREQLIGRPLRCLSF